ncbi:MAG: isoprenoid biosynthesis glyoxalase ElbB [Desulforegulaceae bacterium]|nr:isoprenoid biosynthesis glyoxalase ElbB [Desulforegulaceae bacterium]
MKSIGIILSGCGVNDGTEIHEAIITMLCLDKINADISYFAPDTNQSIVIDHTNQKKMLESRNVKIESARITRGNIKNIKEADPQRLDALILPGGTGVIKNLSKIFENPKKPEINQNLLELISCLHSLNKPIGSICISPLLIAAILGEFQPILTIGDDINIAQMIENYGGIHKKCKYDSIITDEKNFLVSTPAYMVSTGPAQVYEGISKLVDKVIELCDKKPKF